MVFARPQQPGDHLDSTETFAKSQWRCKSKKQSKERDYLHTLFESKAYSPPRSLPLTTLLQSAHKTLSTADHLIEYQEQMNCRTLKRIYQLQNANRWPLRQMQRAAEPVRPTSHWDFSVRSHEMDANRLSGRAEMEACRCEGGSQSGCMEWGHEQC